MAGTARVKADVSLSMQGQSPFSLHFDRGVSVDEGFPPYTFELADGTTDQSLIAIGTGGLTTVSCLAIVADQAISLKLGATASNVAFTMTANVPVILYGVSLTVISVSYNPGDSTTANVTVLIAGT